MEGERYILVSRDASSNNDNVRYWDSEVQIREGQAEQAYEHHTARLFDARRTVRRCVLVM